MATALLLLAAVAEPRDHLELDCRAFWAAVCRAPRSSIGALAMQDVPLVSIA